MMDPLYWQQLWLNAHFLRPWWLLALLPLVAILLLRGAGEPNRTHRLYNHGDTADLRWLWQELRAREPNTRIASVGWSLGGNVLLKAMSEEGDAAIPDRVAAASVPFRLHECADRLRRGVSRIYQQRMLGDLKTMVRLKHQKVPVPPGVNLPPPT